MASAIIVAAGRGTRMKDAVRKQYLMLAGRPILAHTLRVFDACADIESIYLVVPETDFDFCRSRILSRKGFIKRTELVPGGTERQESVYIGLQAIDGLTDNIVVIHDGVRPFILQEQVSACIAGAKDAGACILGIPVSDTLKKVDGSGCVLETVKRESIWQAQTPQAFQFDLILNAHQRARDDGYRGTDDALLVERMGKNVQVISGSRRNIKITNKEDLVLARALLQAQYL